MALNTINQPSFTGLLSTTPAAMSSFFATETYFTPATSALAQPTQSAASVVHSSSPKVSATSRSTSTKSSSSSTQTSSPSSLSSLSSQTSAAAEITSTSSEASSSVIITSSSPSTLTTSFTSPAAASTAGSSAVLSEQKQCKGISCSAGKQAAVAVPVVLICLGFIIAFIIFARRRRRQDDSKSAASTGGEPRGSKWARHLRVFSFDAELLIGGHSSTAGSVRSHPTGRSHPSVTSLRSHQPSVRSLESPAPPYRDALAAGNPQMSERPDSSLTDPPPYIANRASHRPNSRLSVISRPVTAASDPFADPSEDDEPTLPASRRPIMRRLSSAYHPVGPDADDVSFVSSQVGGPSDVGSIQQAEVTPPVSDTKQ